MFSESYPHPLSLCCLTYSGLLHITWGLTEMQTKGIVYIIYFICSHWCHLYLLFWHFHGCVCISGCVCFHAAVHVCLCLFVWLCLSAVCVRTCVCVYCVLSVGWLFILQWLGDITAIYWAIRDWAHWDFYRPTQMCKSDAHALLKQTLRNSKTQLGQSENHTHKKSFNAMHSFPVCHSLERFIHIEK